MKVIIEAKESKEIDFTHIKVRCGARYWEDATINGVEDTNGDLIPFRDGDYFCPTIRLDDGFVEGWKIGDVANIHYKCCDDGEYWLIDSDGKEYKYERYYVPNILDVYNDSFGDYLILNINCNGFIEGWDKHKKSSGILDFFDDGN